MQENCGLKPLAGQTAVVSGSSRGIGRAIALKLASLGANVTVNYRNHEQFAIAVAKECERLGVKTLLAKADVSQPDQVLRLVQDTRLYLGPPTILVNNAGQTLQKTLLDTSYEEWQHLLAVNAGSAFLLTKQILPDMIRAGSGRIIMISSVFGLIGGSCEVAYSAAKGALVAFTKALAKEVGRAGITVNAVAPGAIETDMLSAYSEEEISGLLEEHPVGRLGSPADVSECVGFLALPTSSYLTGQVLSPNGGWVT